MGGEARILIVDDDLATLNLFRTVLAREGGFEVHTATDGTAGFAMARVVKPDLILSDFTMPGMNGFELCSAVRGTSQLEGTMFVVITAVQNPRHKIDGLNLGVDDYLTKPIGTAELLAKARSALRLKSLNDALRREKDALAQLNQKVERSFDELVDILSHMVELQTPGAADRAVRLADGARVLGESVQASPAELGDISLAARLHEIGRIVRVRRASDPPAGEESLVQLARCARFSAAVMKRVAKLEGAAGIVSCLYENWDGSGHPYHARRAEIPLGSRILRVAIDFFELLDNGDVDAALAEIASRAGTAYDPLVAARAEQLRDRLSGNNWRIESQRIPITELVQGMTIGEDLITEFGLKLVARDTTVTRSILDTILRRHADDPMVRGVVVKRSTGVPSKP